MLAKSVGTLFIILEVVRCTPDKHAHRWYPPLANCIDRLVLHIDKCCEVAGSLLLFSLADTVMSDVHTRLCGRK